MDQINNASKNGQPQDHDGEKLWWHRWGYADTKFEADPETREVFLTGNRYAFCGYPMPYVLPFFEDKLGISIDLTDIRPEREEKVVSPPQINEGFVDALKDTFPQRMYSTDDRVRLSHSHGQATPSEVFQVLYGQLKRCADMVFFCETEADAEKLIELATRYDVCLVPYGGGTNVSGALLLPENESRMIVALNTRYLNKIEWLDKENMQVCVQAGVTGAQLQEYLAENGFTCGHTPDSMEHSTVGGWISTNASGMKKNRYGNIEDIVQSVTLLTPSGLIEQSMAAPRLSMGMQLQKLLFGSEGNLGLITKAILKLRPLPEAQEYMTLLFPSFEKGTEFIKTLSQTSFIPASIRLVDNNQVQLGRAFRPKDKKNAETILFKLVRDFYLAKVRKYDLNKVVAATVVVEGDKEEVKYQQDNIKKLLKEFDGFAPSGVGTKAGKRGYSLTFAIAYIRDFIGSYYILGDTCETTVPWSKIDIVLQKVSEEIKAQHKKYNLPGTPFLTYRIPQIYETGVCIYFTFAFCFKGVENSEEILHQIDYDLREVMMQYGASISHHHGVGKSRKDFLGKMVSEGSINLIKKMKEASDPTNVFGIRNNALGLTEAQKADSIQ